MRLAISFLFFWQAVKELTSLMVVDCNQSLQMEDTGLAGLREPKDSGDGILSAPQPRPQMEKEEMKRKK